MKDLSAMLKEFLFSTIERYKKYNLPLNTLLAFIPLIFYISVLCSKFPLLQAMHILEFEKNNLPDRGIWPKLCKINRN